MTKEQVLKKVLDTRGLQTPYELVEFLKLSAKDRDWVYQQWGAYCADYAI